MSSFPFCLQVNLNDLAKKLGVGSGNLRFADEAAMLDKLKVGRRSEGRGSEGPVRAEVSTCWFSAARPPPGSVRSSIQLHF